MPEPILETRDLVKEYPQGGKTLRVLNGVNLTVDRGARTPKQQEHRTEQDNQRSIAGHIIHSHTNDGKRRRYMGLVEAPIRAVIGECS